MQPIQVLISVHDSVSGLMLISCVLRLPFDEFYDLDDNLAVLVLLRIYKHKTATSIWIFSSLAILL
jgi:hypothetical protein